LKIVVTVIIADARICQLAGQGGRSLSIVSYKVRCRLRGIGMIVKHCNGKKVRRVPYGGGRKELGKVRSDALRSIFMPYLCALPFTALQVSYLGGDAKKPPPWDDRSISGLGGEGHYDAISA
jgi:hypothetical protein